MTDMFDRINALADTIDSMPDRERDQIIDTLIAKKAERQKYAGRTPLRTPMQAAAANPNAKPLLYTISMMCQRIGFDFGDGSELLDVGKLETCIRAAKDRGEKVDSWGHQDQTGPARLDSLSKKFLGTASDKIPSGIGYEKFVSRFQLKRRTLGRLLIERR